MLLDVLTQPVRPRPTAAATVSLPIQPSSPPRDRRDLLHELLDDQQNLTAIERFARKHDRGDLPAQAKYYRELIPLTAPKAGQQYAFDVDLDACTGCKACVAGCHNMNGLDEDEAFRDVGALVGGSLDLPVMQHVTSACHHCLEPACMHGCPVRAYEKDEVTGIVKHLDDQCIGCQYCVLKCPYDVPKYNPRKGIVRKCDMCSDRLAIGEAPACVQSCPNQAIRITIVERAKVVEDAEVGFLVPGAPAPDYTLPTTNYRTKRVMPRNMLPGDYHDLAPQHVHLPLVAMLVLTQLSVGAFLVERIFSEWLGGAVIGGAVSAFVALGLGLLALAASTLHLGRPLYAFRAVIGLRTSWLSREIVAFGLFAGLAAGYAGAVVFFSGPEHALLRESINTGVIFTGLLGVLCSAMLYHDTRREFWTIGQTGTKFALTLLLLGTATTLLSSTIHAQVSQTSVPMMREMCMAVAGTTGFKLVFELWILTHLRSRLSTAHRRTARLLIGPLVHLSLARLIIGIAGGVAIPLIWLNEANAEPSVVAAALILLSSLAGELLERALFFAAVVAPKMPGHSAGGGE